MSSTTDPIAVARLAAATQLPLNRAEFYLDAAGGDEAAALALWRGESEEGAIGAVRGDGEERQRSVRACVRACVRALSFPRRAAPTLAHACAVSGYAPSGV